VSEDRVTGLRRQFKALHESGCFVIPNPWDVGSARLLVAHGFKALASTSAGLAWSLGRRDGRITLDDALTHLRALTSGVDVPVSADFEGGFAVAAEDVAANVQAAAATGLSGLSIEDRSGDSAEPLMPFTLSVERIAAAREALDLSAPGLTLTARTEGFIVGRPDLEETLRRLVAFAEAGADCLFAPGIRTPEQVAAVVKAVAPKPVNVLVAGPYTSVAQLAALGVRRISVGGGLARAAWTGFLGAARELAESGTFEGLGAALPSPEMQRLFPE
jgi:2-methylisocitrate lyase-like PEP mutase family enzyme